MRPFPVDVLPSHIHLSAEDQSKLFSSASMTIERKHSQPGQVIYKETLAVFGEGEGFLRLRILGPEWKESSVELTPTEATLLGIDVKEAKEGDVSLASPVRLLGPVGEVFLEKACIVPAASLLMSVEDAKSLHVKNGDEVSVRIQDLPDPLDDVLVRVHPKFQLRLQIHQDIARDMWITGALNAQIIK